MTIVDTQEMAQAALWVLSAGVIVAFVRLARGPSLPDRIVALDMVAQLLVGGVLLLGIATNDVHQVRVATVLALINFLGTIAFAFFAHRRDLS